MPNLYNLLDVQVPAMTTAAILIQIYIVYRLKISAHIQRLGMKETNAILGGSEAKAL